MRYLVKVVLYSLLTASVYQTEAFSAEIIYDSPEDLKATEPDSIEPAITAADTNNSTPKEPTTPARSLEETQARFKELKRQIEKGTYNLDVYFEYAQLATSLGENKKAISAYEHMLSLDPSLQRVKLELALVKMRSGKLKQAKLLFTEVLNTNPPEAVQTNIKQALSIVDKGLRKDIFSGSVTVGYNIDTNGNSAASTGRTTFVNTDIPLTTASRAQRDGQMFAVATLTHLHKFDFDKDFYRVALETTGTLYRTHQDTEVALDIGLASLKIGPTIEFPDYGTKLSLSGTTSIIDLDANKYLRSRSIDLGATKTIGDKILLTGTYTHEYRIFINTPTVSTYSDRTGTAQQQAVSVTYAMTPKDVFNVTTTWRQEFAVDDIYSNRQESVSGSYIRVLPKDFTFNTLLGFRHTKYLKADTLISSGILRNDRERTMSFGLSKKLKHNVTTSLGYQYKNVTSNIQNYDYYNHRYSATLGWAF